MNPLGQGTVQEEEEDTDYDVFASVRPGGITVDDNPEDEADGEDIDQFAQFRPSEEEIESVKSEKRKPKKQPTPLESSKDYVKQAIKETLIGAGGTWGDLAELGGVRPNNDKQYDKEREIFQRLNETGESPSVYDLENLTPESSPTLPTSKTLRRINDLIGGPGESETPAGKYGARQGKLYGSGLAFGQVNPVPAFIAGGYGQAVEDMGGGPLLQAAAEISTILLTQGKGSGKTLVSSVKKDVKEKINKLRALGYTEEDITLAINSASKGKKMGIKASKGSKTEQAFQDFSEHSDDLVNNILTSEIPGSEKGIGKIHEMASDAYGQVANEASKLVIKDSTPFIDSATKVVKEVRRNLGKNPEAEPFLNRLHDAVIDSTKNPTAENYMNFYKELNKAGNWMTRNQKDRLLTQVKNGIKDTFRNEGPEGRKLAQRFEDVNAGIKKAYQAEDLIKIMDKSTTQQGIDYTKLNKAFDNKENINLFEDVLGKTQADNLRMISKIGKEVKDFDKSYKATSLFTGTPTSMASQAAYLIYSGSWPAVAALKIGEAGSRKLTELSLRDPKFQNLMIKGLHAIKNKSPKTFRSVNENMEKYLDEQGIKVNLTK